MACKHSMETLMILICLCPWHWNLLKLCMSCARCKKMCNIQNIQLRGCMHAYVRVCACVVSVFKDTADCRRVSPHSWCLIIFPLPFHLCSCFPLLTFRSNLVRQTDHRCPAEASHTESAWPLGKPARFIFVTNSSGLLSSTPFGSLLVNLMFYNWTRRAIKTLWTATLIFLVRYFYLYSAQILFVISKI